MSGATTAAELRAVFFLNLLAADEEARADALEESN